MFSRGRCPLRWWQRPLAARSGRQPLGLHLPRDASAGAASATGAAVRCGLRTSGGSSSPPLAFSAIWLANAPPTAINWPFNREPTERIWPSKRLSCSVRVGHFATSAI